MYTIHYKPCCHSLMLLDYLLASVFSTVSTRREFNEYLLNEWMTLKQSRRLHKENISPAFLDLHEKEIIAKSLLCVFGVGGSACTHEHIHWHEEKYSEEIMDPKSYDLGSSYYNLLDLLSNLLSSIASALDHAHRKMKSSEYVCFPLPPPPPLPHTCRVTLDNLTWRKWANTQSRQSSFPLLDLSLLKMICSCETLSQWH